MAWEGRGLLTPPVVLVLLVSGSWGLTDEPEELHAVAGETVRLKCQYPPQRGPYVPKTWCRQTSPDRCTRLVTTSQPRTAATKGQHTIWDDPWAGFFTVTVTRPGEDDSGDYWCGSFNSSHNWVTIFRIVTLVVSPASSSAWTTTRLPTTTALITSPEGISSPSINGSEHRMSSSPSSLVSASPELLLSVQCGLLLVKGLVLCILCMLLSFRRHRGRRLCGHSSDGGL